ncbi:MAG: RagB/SusD family nutrient uptake outer membrane protein, partial [Chitinophagaceae bacterium]|nr:RagB/SusD family nutrient uptake outer membrane protein [Chitinophagaceae bacterium]
MKRIRIKSVYIIGSFVLLMTGFTSCKKYIYQEPINSTYSEKFWTSATSVEQAENAMYVQLRNCLQQDASFFINGDLVSGSFESPDWNYATLKASSSPAFNFSYVPYLENSLQNWSRFYKLIAQANIILKNVNGMSTSIFPSEDAKKAYLAEALFMRAFTYFYVIRIWGDPVYVTEVYDDVDYGNIPPVARTPEAQVLDSCIADLKVAAASLPFAGGDLSKVLRANKGTVYALLAHIYAWKHDYANAHLACQEVINNGSYVLEPMDTYTNIWKGQSSNENIWELATKAIGSNTNEADFGFFATFLRGSMVDNIKGDCWISPAGGFVDQFYSATDDKRYEKILTAAAASGNTDEGYLLTKYANFQYKSPDTKTTPFIDNNLVIFRLSDIILLDAEARAFTGDFDGAKQMLALTEDRAGITSYQDVSSEYEIADEVVMERGRELIGEGT